MAAFQAPLSGRIYSTRNDARYRSVVAVHYPLHPLYGRGGLPVSRRRDIGSIAHVELQIDGQRQAVPAWMTDEPLCARLTCGFTPCCCLPALLELLSLIRSTGL